MLVSRFPVVCCVCCCCRCCGRAFFSPYWCVCSGNGIYFLQNCVNIPPRMQQIAQTLLRQVKYFFNFKCKSAQTVKDKTKQNKTREEKRRQMKILLLLLLACARDFLPFLILVFSFVSHTLFLSFFLFEHFFVLLPLPLISN